MGARYRQFGANQNSRDRFDARRVALHKQNEKEIPKYSLENRGNVMKKDLTYIVMLLDRSGSMMSLVKDVVGGVNLFLEQQRKVPGELLMTLAQFDNELKVDYEATDLRRIPSLSETSFVPRGGTALLDAFASLIDSTGANIAKMAEGDRPENVIFVVFTDGQENASKKFNAAQLKERVEHQQSKYNWKFLFLGANMDSFSVAGGYGLTSGMNFDASAAGTYRAAQVMSSYVGASRGGKLGLAERLYSTKNASDATATAAIEEFEETLKENPKP